MFERQITRDEVRSVVERDDLVEEYVDDTPYPSRLLVGSSGNRYLHVVVARDSETGSDIVVTVYEPSPEQWSPPDFRTRKRQ